MLLLFMQEPAGVGDNLYETIAVAPLVVVPSQYLEHIPTNNSRTLQINYGRMAIADKIATDELFVSDIEDSLVECFLRGFLKRFVHLVNAHATLCNNREVAQRDDRRRHPNLH